MNDADYYKYIYDIKRAGKNSEIAEENGATEEQTDAISWLCATRHYMHCNKEDMFISESGNCNDFCRYIESGINDRLKTADLPIIDLPSLDEFPDDATYELDELTYDEAYEKCLELMEDVDRRIIIYLGEFDKKYKTDFQPTLKRRMADLL